MEVGVEVGVFRGQPELSLHSACTLPELFLNAAYTQLELSLNSA